MSGKDDRAQHLRDDFAAAIEIARQTYPHEFIESKVSEYLDGSFYRIEFGFKVQDTNTTQIMSIVTDLMDINMKRICSNWKLKYEIKPASSGFRAC